MTNVLDLAVDPQRAATLYATVNYRDVWKTDDRGAQWRKLPVLSSAVAIDTTTPGALYSVSLYATPDRIKKSTDRGDTWAAAVNGLPSPLCAAISSLLIDTHRAGTAYAAMWPGGDFCNLPREARQWSGCGGRLTVEQAGQSCPRHRMEAAFAVLPWTRGTRGYFTRGTSKECTGPPIKARVGPECAAMVGATWRGDWRSIPRTVIHCTCSPNRACSNHRWRGKLEGGKQRTRERVHERLGSLPS
jgi:hypothetical protein